MLRAGLLRCASSRRQRPVVLPLRAAIPDANNEVRARGRADNTTCRCDRAGSAHAPVAALGVTRAAEPPTLKDGACSSAHPLRQGTCHIVRLCCGPSFNSGAASIASATHRAPPNCAPVLFEGDLWGDL